MKDWCAQHEITVKAFYYHLHQLRQKGYDIPQRIAPGISQGRQEAFCLHLSDGRGTPSGMAHEAASGAAIRIDFHGVFIEVSNHAAQETISNIFHALHGLC